MVSFWPSVKLLATRPEVWFSANPATTLSSARNLSAPAPQTGQPQSCGRSLKATPADTGYTSSPTSGSYLYRQLEHMAAPLPSVYQRSAARSLSAFETSSSMVISLSGTKAGSAGAGSGDDPASPAPAEAGAAAGAEAPPVLPP